MVFGASAVFIDTDAIRIGDEWPTRIENALQRATVLIATIGPDWLHLADEDGRRRLDLPDDWVCNEIKYAINHKLVVVPLLVSRAQLPKRSALPPQIASLSNYQTFELRDTHWDNDVNQLLSTLERNGFHHIGPRVSYPRPYVRPEPLSPEELAEICRKGWEVVVSPIPGNEPLKRTELMRVYEFASFEAALEFMSEASKFISSFNHHPRWENIWRNVTVWLTTWDIGHKPSHYDLELAQYLDSLFERYPLPKKRANN
jgi:pterin-4a-carbinolamine dehydratase